MLGVAFNRSCESRLLSAPSLPGIDLPSKAREDLARGPFTFYLSRAVHEYLVFTTHTSSPTPCHPHFVRTPQSLTILTIPSSNEYHHHHHHHLPLPPIPSRSPTPPRHPPIPKPVQPPNPRWRRQTDAQACPSLSRSGRSVKGVAGFGGYADEAPTRLMCGVLAGGGGRWRGRSYATIRCVLREGFGEGMGVRGVSLVCSWPNLFLR